MRYSSIIGVDEAGRGPLAGPVAVGAVMVPASQKRYFSRMFRDIRDSKQISEKTREEWLGKMLLARREGILNFTVAMVGASIIDRVGIARAIRIAIARSLARLGCNPVSSRVLLDGTLRAPAVYHGQQTIVRGDETERIIAAASIAAKVTRDRKMKRLAREFPKYGFEHHKGYGTEEHRNALRTLGFISGIHRVSFLGNFDIDREPVSNHLTMTP